MLVKITICLWHRQNVFALFYVYLIGDISDRAQNWLDANLTKYPIGQYTGTHEPNLINRYAQEIDMVCVGV